jgi:hypothetical protein
MFNDGGTQNMKARCSVDRSATGQWHARHSSSELGDAVVTADSREEALTKLQRELQYRIEWCPCSGVSGDTVELDVSAG